MSLKNNRERSCGYDEESDLIFGGIVRCLDAYPEMIVASIPYKVAKKVRKMLTDSGYKARIRRSADQVNLEIFKNI